jgi:hypothetical protein
VSAVEDLSGSIVGTAPREDGGDVLEIVPRARGSLYRLPFLIAGLPRAERSGPVELDAHRPRGEGE